MKEPTQSKTIVFSFLIGILAFLNDMQLYVTDPGALNKIVMGIAFVTAVLRLRTTDPIAPPK